MCRAEQGVRRGERLPGSRFLRWFCDSCGEPIRVVSVPDVLEGDRRYCEDCSGLKERLMHEAGGCSGPLDEDAHGYFANALRQLEGD